MLIRREKLSFLLNDLNLSYEIYQEAVLLLDSEIKKSIKGESIKKPLHILRESKEEALKDVSYAFTAFGVLNIPLIRNKKYEIMELDTDDYIIADDIVEKMNELNRVNKIITRTESTEKNKIYKIEKLKIEIEKYYKILYSDGEYHFLGEYRNLTEYMLLLYTNDVK